MHSCSWPLMKGTTTTSLRMPMTRLLSCNPRTGGTAVGIIASLIQIMQVDPDAIVGVFPCDHYYSDEEAFRSVVRSAVGSAEELRGSIIIVGAEAEYAETDYRWIEPAQLVAQ